MQLTDWALVILFSPLLGFVIQAFFGSRLPRKGDWVPTLFIFVSLVVTCVFMLPAFFAEGGLGQAEVRNYWSLWLGTSFSVDFGIHIDNLTIAMLFVVTLVSFLVHLYSWGYMKGEARYNYFFAYLGLFSFSMLGLCVTNNLLFLFIFWELVGVCSYFLIGFYFEKKSASNAAIKAFMTTRLGDLGFFLAILIIGSVVGGWAGATLEGSPLNFDRIFESVAAENGPWTGATMWGVGLLTLTGIFLFCGPIGKSAQFPLHVWLPDAMEGPTPVSALIHAATMVAAGVYLVGRMFPFLAGPEYFQGDFFSSDALLVVANVGAFTAFFAATIAFAQTDIKKVLAYSTVSQLGYMFIGLGVGSVAAGLFHLTTHAFFKALLFLGSGSVIHAVHSNELEDMGGLWKKMRTTWATFGIATLAIAGLPFLSGFYSKEAILGQAYGLLGHGGSFFHGLPFILGITTAGMTAFYMFRLFFKTFHGAPRNQEAFDHAHESPWTMTIPLTILAVLSVVAGGNHMIANSHEWFVDRVDSAILAPYAAPAAGSVVAQVQDIAHEHHGLVMGLSIGMFFVGLVLAGLFFLPLTPLHARNAVARPPLSWLHYCLKRLWFLDDLFTWLALSFVHVLRRIIGTFDMRVIDGFVNFWGTFCRFVTAVIGSIDYHGVDGTVRGLGESTLAGGRRLRRIQTGLLQEYVYASVFIIAGVVLVTLLIVRG